MPKLNTVTASAPVQRDSGIRCMILPLCIETSDSLPQWLPEGVKKKVEHSCSRGYFSGKPGALFSFSTEHEDLDLFILSGLGSAETLSMREVRNALGTAVKECIRLKVSEAALADSYSGMLDLDTAAVARQTVEALVNASYRFIDYNADKKKNFKEFERVEILTEGPSDAWASGIRTGLAIAEGSSLARDLGHHPGNVATPSYLAECAESIAKEGGMTCRIFDRETFTAMGMGGLAGVSRGSSEEPKFILLEYHGASEEDKPVVFVGKGLTFDTGGISLKPGAGMEEMKYDMLGAAAVLGIMKAIALLRPAINAVAAIPSTDNMPDGRSVKPGDILTAYNGKTIEVLNTDAEGRLILADALAYVSKEYQPRFIFDFATLTGAVVVALGHAATGIMGSGSAEIAALKEAGDISGERVWELPLYDDYSEMLKSGIADVRNIGAARQAGSSVAGAFLKEFVGEDIPWVHFDIAGSGYQDKEQPTVPKGPSGVGPALVTEFLIGQKLI